MTEMDEKPANVGNVYSGVRAVADIELQAGQSQATRAHELPELTEPQE